MQDIDVRLAKGLQASSPIALGPGWLRELLAISDTCEWSGSDEHVLPPLVRLVRHLFSFLGSLIHTPDWILDASN